jgi:hypothetical protein
MGHSSGRNHYQDWLVLDWLVLLSFKGIQTNSKNKNKLETHVKYHTQRILLIFTLFFEFDDNFFHKFIDSSIRRCTHKDTVLFDFGIGVLI